MKEYKVLGLSTENVDGQQVSLMESMRNGIPTPIEGVLNTLAKEGWEPVFLQPPYIFSRDVDFIAK